MSRAVGNVSRSNSAPVHGRSRSPLQLLEPMVRGQRRGKVTAAIARRVGASTARDAKRDTDTPPAAQSPADFCRQARRLRAVFEHDPVRMHRQLSRLSVTAAAEGREAPGDLPAPTSLSQRISLAWTNTARLGRNGMTVLTRLGQGLSMGAVDDAEATPASTWDEDAERYTLLDEHDPVHVNEGFPSTPDRSFRAYVARSLAGQRDLRYSQRLALLKEAGRRGIGRFEANLMIAAVQHDLKLKNAADRAPRRLLAVSGLLAFVAVQGLIVLGYWRLFRS